MKQETDLVVVEKKKTLPYFTMDRGLDPLVAMARELVDGFNHDMSTQKGRDKTASLSLKVAKLKVKLDDMGKELVSDWKTQAKTVDVNRKQMRDALDALKVEARAPLTEYEALEQEKLDVKLALIATLEALGLQQDEDGTVFTIEQLKSNLDSVNSIIVDSSLGDQELSATKQKAKSIEQLNFYIASEEKRIKEAAELERLRAAEEARVQKERDDQLQKEAADKARLEAEAVAKEAAEKVEREFNNAIREKEEAEAATKQAERDKIAAEENAKIEAGAAAERARLTEVKRQEDEKKEELAAAEKREANNKHVSKIRSEAKQGLMKFVDEETAKKIVLAIHAGEVKNVKISY